MFKKLGVSALLIVSARAACWSESQGFPCCKSTTPVSYEDSDGAWGIENNEWCGIPTPEPTPAPSNDCWAKSQGYDCCPSGTEVKFTDEFGDWGVVNNEWCGIIAEKPVVEECWSEKVGYPCCETTTELMYEDVEGRWGFENGDWCGLRGGKTVTTKKTTTTSRRTTTTTTTRTTRKTKPTYSVIYKTGNKLESGYDNWGWDSSLKFKDGAMVLIPDPDTYGSASIKKVSGNYGKGGCVRLDVKSSKNEAIIKVEGGANKVYQLGRTDGGETDFTTYKFDIDVDDFPNTFDRINIQDATGNGEEIAVRYLIYSTGSCEDFVDPIDTSYVPVATTRKPVRSTYTTIFTNVYSMPSGYENWGWGCDVSFSGGAMVITPEAGEYGAVSLKSSRTFTGGSLRFDMKNEGKVNVMVESTQTEDKITIASINASDSWETYIFDIDFGSFDRINFQDAKGTGDRIWVKNLVYSTGYAEDFVDPL